MVKSRATTRTRAEHPELKSEPAFCMFLVITWNDTQRMPGVTLICNDGLMMCSRVTVVKRKKKITMKYYRDWRWYCCRVLLTTISRRVSQVDRWPDKQSTQHTGFPLTI